MIRVLFLCLLITSRLYSQDDVNVVFNKPAIHFTESMPLGNGQLGAMVFGNPNRERIVLNEKSLWSGGIQDPNRHDASKNLPEIQRLLKLEKNKEAQELLQQTFTCAGAGSGNGSGKNVKFGCYQVLGDLFIDWKDTSTNASAYSRILQLDKAIGTTSWTRNGIKFTEEVIVSAPQNAIVIRLRASKAGELNFVLSLERKEQALIGYSKDAIEMTGTMDGGEGSKGMNFAASVRPVLTGGTIQANNANLSISNATECIIVISAATDFSWPDIAKRGPDPLPVASNSAKKAAAIGWNALVKAHADDYHSFFSRCRLKFTSGTQNSKSNLTTIERLRQYQQGGSDPGLAALYFNFGRYLLISSSRPGQLPSNLQGLWAEEYQTPWNGDYHLDINVQMNYWLAESTNLADLHMPLIEYVKQLVPEGTKTAKAYYNSDGWVAHVISNPWKFTAPGEQASWGSTISGAGWLCEHLFQHYQYKPDNGYLNSIYPVLKGASKFYTDILIEDPKTGWLVTAPSNSPENAYRMENGFEGQTTMGPTIDMQIGRELLKNTIAAANILKTDKAFADSLQSIVSRLAPNQVSKRTGGIQEWIRDYEETEPQHRHVSQLYGLYPYDEINPAESPELVEAARKTLTRRGDEGTGWSRAWKIAFWARLHDGDHALKLLKALLEPVAEGGGSIEYKSGAGTYANLFCAHPPFQIDGNFGATAAIAEMLLQCTGSNAAIRLLPALPTSADWANGSITGLRTKNDFQVDMNWENGAIVNAKIHSKSGRDCAIILPAGYSVYGPASRKIELNKVDNSTTVFKTKAGESYIVRKTKP